MPDFIRDYFHVDEMEATIADQIQIIADRDQTIARYRALYGDLPAGVN